MNTYFQCHLQRGASHTTGWIERRAAKVGATVELLPSGEMWEVVERFPRGMPEYLLKEHQKLNRNSLPSVQGMQ